MVRIAAITKKEQARRAELAAHARQMLLENLPIEYQDGMCLSINISGWYLQVSFSPLHPLMVICLARQIKTPATIAQYLDTNDINLHSILGCHTINSDTGCYAYRATQWLDAELTHERFMEMLSRCMGEAERGYKNILKNQL